MVPMSPPKLLVPKSTIKSSVETIGDVPNLKEDNLERNILAMTNLDLQLALQAMTSVEKVGICLYTHMIID